MKTKVKRDSLSVYFQERCGGEPKSKAFWPTNQTLPIPEIHQKSDEPVLLKDSDDSLIPDQEMVVEKLNTFYINIAGNLGINVTKQNDETTQVYKSPNMGSKDFHFKTVTDGEINTCIKKLDPKKSTGMDLIPPNSF